MKNFICVIISISLLPSLYGQTKDEEIQRLQQLAKANEERALKAEALADQYKSEANQAKQMLERLRFQALGKIYSEKSFDQSDKEMAGLLALQAYSFNKQGKGYEFDNDIYGGLVHALARYSRLPQSLESNYPVTNFLQTTSDAVFSLSNYDNVLKWTNQNGDWQSSEIIKIKKGTINAVKVSHSGKLLILGVLVGNQKHHLELFNLTKPDDEPKIIPCAKNTIEQLAFKPDDSGFYCLANAGLSIMIGDLTSIKEVIQSNEKISAIDVSPDGALIAGAGTTGNLFIWNTTNFSPTTFKVLNEGTGLETLSFSRDGKHIVFGDRKGVLYMFNLSSKTVVRQLVSHKYKVGGIAFSHSGKFMATTSKDHTARLWNLSELNRPPIIITQNHSFGPIVFSPDDSQMLTAPVQGNTVSSNVMIKAWPVNIEQMVAELCGLVGRDFTTEEKEIIFSPDLPYVPACPSQKK